MKVQSQYFPNRSLTISEQFFDILMGTRAEGAYWLLEGLDALGTAAALAVMAMLVVAVEL